MHKSAAGRILVADNDEDILIALESALENGGYATTVAWSGAEARKLLSEVNFDLLVLDDYLSDADSVQTLTECRGAGIEPLVVVTYHRFPSVHEESRLRNLGVSALVNKRAHLELIQVVDHLLMPRWTGTRNPFDTDT
jgi:DNA-binding response OmpR family regulator